VSAFKLVIFDVDGTLAEKYVLDLLPGVRAFFHLVYQSGCPQAPRLAIATNQGGVGMRRWLEGRGRKAGQFPTATEIEQRMQGLLEGLGAPPDLPVYVSYRYQNKEGAWAPVPAGQEENPRWQSSWRKPNPGMLQQAMQDAGAEPQETLFVGDRPEDREAAQRAGCAFQWAGDFFARQWRTCEDLMRIVE
jgi:HAD superfamily hydrolase (TIGR01662 family)